jgi:hypothetical protein
MDTLLISTWGAAALLIILFQDPNVPKYIGLRISQTVTSIRGAILRERLQLTLSLTKRSLRNDWFGRRLRDSELRSIQRNPAYREIFDRDI